MRKAGFLCLIFLAAIYPKLVAVKLTDAVEPAIYSGIGLPKIHQMTKLSVNPDSKAKPLDLNIVADYFCYSDDRFYTAIQAKSGSFPKSAKLGTTLYTYMTVITQPDNDEYVWALTYINVPIAGLKPGLYRIDKRKKQELTSIGDIEFHIDKDNSLLLMSCKITDLLTDPLFSAWYNKAAPNFGLLSITSSTSIIPFKTRTVDSTYPGRIINLRR